MAISTKLYDMTGNQQVLDGTTIAWDSMTNVAIPSATRPVIIAGTGDPTGVLTATKGSLFLNLTGSSVATRLFVNNGTTAWVAVTTAS